jgi:hypothetical protein
MNKCIFTVAVDGYHPEILAETIPLMEKYAYKIEADFRVIIDRKFPELPPTYEKMQIYDMGKGYDLNLLLDADIYVTEDMYDVTRLDIVPEDSVGVWMEYDPRVTIKFDEYLKLDGSETILATNFVLTHAAQHELWRPLELSINESLNRMKRTFVIDEYCIGRNLKRYGFKKAQMVLPGAADNLFFHGNVTTRLTQNDVPI